MDRRSILKTSTATIGGVIAATAAAGCASVAADGSDKSAPRSPFKVASVTMTRRDLQRGMGDQEKPWEIGKSFDHAAVLGPIHPATKTGHFTKGAISLAVNGTMRQDSNLDKMIWSVAEQIAKLSEAFELKAGGIIYSGTPENVGPVVKGDLLVGRIDGLPELSVRII